MHAGKRLRSSMPRPEAGRPGKLQSIPRYVHADEGFRAILAGMRQTELAEDRLLSCRAGWHHQPSRSEKGRSSSKKRMPKSPSGGTA